MKLGYRYMCLFGDGAQRAKEYLIWRNGNEEWDSTWSDTINNAVILEPRWVGGKLIWLYAGTGRSGKRWLVEFLSNGEEDLHLMQAMTAAKWVEKNRKKK